MRFVLGLAVLTTLAVAVYGDYRVEDESQEENPYFRCGRTWCLKDAFICLHDRYCQAKKHCYRHSNCPEDQYCDTYWRACRKGVRRCTYGNECGHKQICKSGVCQKRECVKHNDCPDNQACDYPPGICKNYSSYCYEGYPGYCRKGYTCVAKQCKKMECMGDNDCKIGDHCDGGFCKPQPGFCMKDGDCAKQQCCAGNGKRGGVCEDLRKPGAWCPLQQSMQTCPCVSGYVCNMKTSSIYWGKCEAADGGSGSGSGSDDF